MTDAPSLAVQTQDGSPSAPRLVLLAIGTGMCTAAWFVSTGHFSAAESTYLGSPTVQPIQVPAVTTLQDRPRRFFASHLPSPRSGLAAQLAGRQTLEAGVISSQGRLSPTAPLLFVVSLFAGMALYLSRAAQRQPRLQLSGAHYLRQPHVMSMATTVGEDCGCAAPAGRTAVINDTVVDAALLRALRVTGADGAERRLGDLTGEGRAVVVFLRHLACPYCWGLAKRWMAVQPSLQAANVRGPIFLSVGNVANLNMFLELNPHVPRGSIFIDAKDFAAYRTVGFKNLFEVTPTTTRLPSFSGGEWWAYLSNVRRVIPYGNENDPDAVQRAVRLLGGTFVLDGPDVAYAWRDRVPGDEPEPPAVLEQLGVPMLSPAAK
eukprot:EG_transcript_15704